jgi:hypothetical protein
MSAARCVDASRVPVDGWGGVTEGPARSHESGQVSLLACARCSASVLSCQRPTAILAAKREMDNLPPQGVVRADSSPPRARIDLFSIFVGVLVVGSLAAQCALVIWLKSS